MKRTKKLLCVLICALLIASLFGCSGKKYEAAHIYDEIFNTKSVELNVNDDGIFTIFKINDMHLINGTCKDDKQSLELLKGSLESADFDMIIIDGDLIEGYNKKLTYNKYKAASLVGDVINSCNVPWTFAPGNNDGEQDGSNEDLIAFFMQYDNFLCGNTEGIDGSIQFFIDLMLDGSNVHSLAILDSHSTDDDGNYDYIKQNQTDWLLNEVTSRKIKTSVFFHMPTPAFKTAYENGIAYEGFPFCDKYDVDNIKKNAEFDASIADNEYISLISVGHVHSNNIAYFYNNRYYQLSSLGGYGAVGSGKTPPSYTLIKINTLEPDTQKMYELSKINPTE